MIPAEGLPVVPVAESPQHQEASSGFAFVRETLSEITGLQSCLNGFKDELSQLRADLERESTSRKDDSESIRRHMNRSIADESQLRVGLESKLEAFQNLSKTWITSLGKDVMASKERLNSLDGTTEQHGSALLAHEERLLGLDAAVALRCTVTDYKQLATSLAELQSEVVRDRSTAQSALDTASRELTRSLNNAEARLNALQENQEKNASVLTTEISGLQDKVESLQNFTKTLAKQNDMEILEDRTQKIESSLRAMNEDLCRKAAATAMKSLSDRVTEMGMEAHTTNTQINMKLDEHKVHIGALQKEASKLERQYELERSRVSNCIVALEKEIATKTSAAETDAVNARVTTCGNAIQRLETLATTKVSCDTFERLQARIDTMEVSVIRKADSETLGKVAQAVTEQARQLETVSSQVRDQNGRMEVVEGRTETLKDQLHNKAESNNVYTVDGVDGIIRGYYSREEMDALLSRIWWRLGDVGKAPNNTGPRPPTR